MTWSHDELRCRFVEAEGAETWRDLIAAVDSSARPAVGLRDSELLHHVECASTAAHYAYLLRDVERALGLLVSAEACTEAVQDPNLRIRALLASLGGKHRVYRNLLRDNPPEDSYSTVHARLTELVPELAKESPAGLANHLFDAGLELAHAARYRGDRLEAQRRYALLATQLAEHPERYWNPEYRALLVCHFGISFACDFLEVAVVPAEPLPPSSDLGDALLQRIPSSLRASLREGARRFPRVKSQYPLLAALFDKHLALYRMWSDHLADANELLAHAEKVFSEFSSPDHKGRTKFELLSREFRALFLLRQGQPAEALRMFRQLRTEAAGYYPRLVHRAGCHIVSLQCAQDGRASTDEFLAVTSSRPALHHSGDKDKIRLVAAKSGRQVEDQPW